MTPIEYAIEYAGTIILVYIRCSKVLSYSSELVDLWTEYLTLIL